MVTAGTMQTSRGVRMKKTVQWEQAINNPAMKKYPGWLLGYLDFIQGDAAKAIEHFSQGEIDNPWFIYYLAAAKEKAGDAEGAAELYKKVADWNLDTVWYSFVRPKAVAKLQE